METKRAKFTLITAVDCARRHNVRVRAIFIKIIGYNRGAIDNYDERDNHRIVK